MIMMMIGYALRLVLVIRGGQYYWSDEHRYIRVYEIYSELFANGPGDALYSLLQYADHTGFTLIAMTISPLQLALSVGLHGRPEFFLWIPAAALAMSSVACIGLVYALARKAGAGKSEALIAALLMFVSNAFFYQARHLFPYDSAIAILLAGLWCAMFTRTRWLHSLIVGIIVGAGLMVYYGYWSLALSIVLWHMLYGQPPFRQMLTRGVWGGGGMAIWPAVFTVISAMVGSDLYIFGPILFSGTIYQGEYAEGWIFPALYLWDAERLILIVWLTGMVIALAKAARMGNSAPTRITMWFGLLAGQYMLLVLTSTVLHKFVVYGRLVKPLIPFMCLMAAYGFGEIAAQISQKPRWKWAAVAGLTGLAAINFVPPVMQRFPVDVLTQADARYGYYTRINTVDAAYMRDVHWLYPRLSEPDGSYAVVVNAAAFDFVKDFHAQPLPDGQIIMSVPHPLRYPPYLYEGILPLERAKFRQNELMMWIIEQE